MIKTYLCMERKPNSWSTLRKTLSSSQKPNPALLVTAIGYQLTLFSLLHFEPLRQWEYYYLLEQNFIYYVSLHACLFNYLTYRIIESQSLCSFPIFVKDGNADLMIFFLFYFIFGEGRMFGVIADGKQVQFCVPWISISGRKRTRQSNYAANSDE